MTLKNSSESLQLVRQTLRRMPATDGDTRRALWQRRLTEFTRGEGPPAPPAPRRHVPSSKPVAQP